jgi:hypothetical protein
VKGRRHGEALVRGLALKRFLGDSRLVVFGEQNFPWNATAASHLVTRSLGTRVLVHHIEDIRARSSRASDAEVDALWLERRGRYVERGVAPVELRQALRTYLAVRSILEEEKALGSTALAISSRAAGAMSPASPRCWLAKRGTSHPATATTAP